MIDLAAHEVLFVPSQYRTIQDAIDAVSGPATIMIEPGIYAEKLVVSGKEYLVIESTRLSRRGVVITGGLIVQVSNLYLSGIEIRTNRTARGILANDSKISLQECVVAGNRTDEPFGAGMYCARSNVRIQKSIIAGNTIETRFPECGGAGVSLMHCRAEIAGCSIQANEIYTKGFARGGGIHCDQSHVRFWRSRVTENCIVAGNAEGGGIYIADAEAVQLGGCVISGNSSGSGVFVAGRRDAVEIYSNTVIRQNSPDDVVWRETPQLQSGILTSPADALLSNAIQKTLEADKEHRPRLFAQLVSEIETFMAAHPEERPWTCRIFEGTDGSKIFRGGVGHSLVIDPAGRLWRARSYEDFDTTYDITATSCEIRSLTPRYEQMREYHRRR